MDDRVRYVAGGAAVGAILGALVGLMVARSQSAGPSEPGADGVPARHDELDGRTIFRLGMSVIGVVRQILQLA